MASDENLNKASTEQRRAHASVIVRSASGLSAKHPAAPITPENVKSYLPTQEVLQAAAAELDKMGFSIDLIAPTQVNISGEPTLFERVFKTRLTEKEYPLFEGQRSGARQTRFLAEPPLTVPEELSQLIESVDLAPPGTLYTSATPPILSYDHMEVPDDVARGMDAVKAHERGVTGLGITLAMVDTGFMTPPHPYYVGKGYTINPVNSYAGDASPGDDSYGHGTGISACALAVAPGVSYTVYKIDLSGSWGEAFSRAAMAGPHVITNSWEVGFDTALQLAINNAVANGIVVLFAAGNGGPVGWPGSEPAVISVGGAFLGSDDSITASSYASSGMNSINPGRQSPDLCGLVGMQPQGIYIALPTQPGSTVDNDFAGGTFPNGDETPPNDGWVVASGTSSATPMVAGVCALMMQADPTLLGNPTGVRAALVRSCIDVTTGSSASGQPAGVGPDNATGAGLVQAYRAVHATDTWMHDNSNSDFGLVPSIGRRPAYPPFTFWDSPDIKVLGAQLANPQTDFDAATETDPIFNQNNYVYLRVGNRGTQDASNVTVRLYYADPSTSLSFPSDWKDGSSGVASAGSISVGGATSDTQTLATVPANGSVVTPQPFVWMPPDPSTATQSRTLPDGRVVGHFCLLARITSTDDPIIFPGGGVSSVVDDNNIAQKNESVYSAPAGMGHFFKFFLRGTRELEAQREFALVADVSALPVGTEIELDVPKKKLRVIHFVGGDRSQPNGTPQAGAPQAELDLRLRVYDESPLSIDLHLNVLASGRSISIGGAHGSRGLLVTAQPPIVEVNATQELVLGVVALKPTEEALASVTVRTPPGTAPGRYPLSIAQSAGKRLVGGVTLVSQVE